MGALTMFLVPSLAVSGGLLGLILAVDVKDRLWPRRQRSWASLIAFPERRGIAPASGRAVGQ